MDVPADGSNLKDMVEKTINEGSIVQSHCEDGCKAQFQAKIRSIIKDVNETRFIIIILHRSIMTDNGIEIVTNMITVLYL